MYLKQYRTTDRLDAFLKFIYIINLKYFQMINNGVNNGVDNTNFIPMW